jgi:O-antigen/teichoic acid export membrane protein
VLALAVTFLTQILIVRYLTKSQYGAFAYALSLVTLGESIVSLGLNRADTRFLSIYDERRDYARLFGTILMVAATILSLGLTLFLLVYGLRGWLAGALISDTQAIWLLVILIALSPLQALDQLLMGVFAVLDNPRAIFFRTHVLAPVLRLGVVLLLVLGRQPVSFLAVGYVVTGAVGTLLFGLVLARLLRARGYLAHFRLRKVELPFRPLFGFALPLLTTDLVYVVMNSFDAVLLGRYRGTVEVAAFRAVQPLANLNTVVFTSFTLLYLPLAARLYERDDREGIQDLYWQTAVWIAILTFPVFAVTFALAEPTTVLLFGARYADSGTYLALLALGSYFQAALGFNGLTIQVFGRLRYTVTVNLVAVVYNAAVNLVLIPRYGALGAAVGTCSALVVHNLLKQVGLGLGTGIAMLDRRYVRVYLTVAAGALALWVISLLISPPAVVGLGLAAVVSAGVLGLNRGLLQLGRVFPEISRLPVVGPLISGK